MSAQVFLRCPFCNGEPEQMRSAFTVKNVRCKKIGCAGREAWFSVVGWNQRPSIPNSESKGEELLIPRKDLDEMLNKEFRNGQLAVGTGAFKVYREGATEKEWQEFLKSGIADEIRTILARKKK